MNDVRYAVRVLRRSPAFTATAALTLGLAIAVNTAVFSVVDAVLVKPLPYPEPDRLGLVTTTTAASGAVQEEIAQNGTTWEAIRDSASTVDRAVFSNWTTGVNVVAGGRASFVQQQRVGAGFFAVLGVAPAAGREFTPEEDRRGGPAAVVLSHSLWQSMFGGDASVLGRTVTIRGGIATVVGVMPTGFQSGEHADLWTPLQPSTTGEGDGENYTILTRLRPGVSRAQADADIRQIGAALVNRRPAADRQGVTFGLQSLQAGMTTSLRRPLFLLWIAVALVLLVATVNLAALLIVQAAGRTKEIATRLALGGGRSVVVRQLATEGVVLALVAAVAGIAGATVALAGLRAIAADVFQIWQPVSLDARSLAVAVLLAVASSVLFGLIPAFHATRVDLQAALADSGARAVAGTRRRWPRQILVAAQVALSVVLLVFAGLLVRSLSHLRHLNPGIDPVNVVTATISLEDARYATAGTVTGLIDGTLARVRATPGIESAAVSLGLPYTRLLNLGFRHLDGPEASAPRGRMTSATYVAGDYFQTLRIPVLAGRVFDERDRAGASGVVIVNEALARQYFGNETPVGRHIQFAGLNREIVGVVGDVQVRPGWGDFGPIAAMPLAYIPLAQANDGLLRLVHGWFSPSFVVRSPAPADATVAALRRALDEADPLLPFASARRMSEVQAAALARPRFLTIILTTLAGAAVLLAALGIHGVVSRLVTERTREMGIRMALGAGRPQLLRMLAVPGIALAAAGTLVGAAAALASRGLVEHFLWGVAPTDLTTFTGVAALLLAIAAVASLLPALRISRLDPARTLRQE